MQQRSTIDNPSRTHHDLAGPVFKASVEILEAHWQGMRVSTAPADRAIAEEGVRIAYRDAGLPSPRIVWNDGPVSLARSWAAPSLHAGGNARETVVSAPYRQVAQRLSAHTDRYARLLRDRFGHDRSCAASAAMCAAAIDTAARPPLRLWPHRLRSLLVNRSWPSSFANSGLSQHELCWLGFDASLLQTLEQHRVAGLRGLELVAASSGWMLPHAHVCWLSDRPVELSFDRWGRLHSASRPAVRYRDGWAMHAWKGTRVPAWAINAPQDITLDWIDAQIDPSVRRAMIDILTPARFVAAGGAACVTRDATGVLWARKWSYRGAVIDSWAAVELPTSGEVRSFRPVPGHLHTLADALAWLHRPRLPRA